MNEDHKKIVENLYTRLSIYLSEKGVFAPTFFMIMEDNKLIPIIVDTDEDISIEEYTSLCTKAAFDNEAVALIFCTEQYIAKLKEDV